MFLNNPINLDLLENFLRNSSFLTLFFTMFFYWVNMAISYPEGPKGGGVAPSFGPEQRGPQSGNIMCESPTGLSGTSREAQPSEGVIYSQRLVQSTNPSGPEAQSVFLKSAKPILNICPLGPSGAKGPFNVAPSGQEQSELFGAPFGHILRRDAYRILNPRTCMVVSNILLVLLLLVRWEKSGHFPLSNLYESLMFLSWCCTFLYLIYPFQPSGYILPLSPSPEGPKVLASPIKGAKAFSAYMSESGGQDKAQGAKNPPARKDTSNKQSTLDNILGSIIAPSALLMNAFATFSLPKEMQQATPLVPALQSNWLMMHVTVMIISYATLIIGSLLSILFLILNKLNTSPLYTALWGPKERSYLSDREAKPIWPQGGGEIKDKYKNSPFLKLDFLSYRIIGLGFPFLTIGILSGAVWANEAWGSYWSWDPKETWALLTWLVFAIYLHTRLTKGWQGEKAAIIASVGFFVVWFCYLGVNLIGEGLHSYGFFKSGYNN